MSTMLIKRRVFGRQQGFTLVELVVAIVIIGVGVAGVIAAYRASVRGSGDRLVDKQMLASAEEMMEEILLKPFAVTGTAPANALVSCGAAASRDAFNDVRDYINYQTSGICDVEGNAVLGAAYGMSVVVEDTNLNGVSAALHIAVTVTHDGNQSITLDGYRTNYGAFP